MYVWSQGITSNKDPLVWLAVVTHWGMHYPGLYQMLQSNLVLFDKYPIGKAHSIIRARSNDSDTGEQVIKKAKASFTVNKPKLISQDFTPTKHLLIFQNCLSKLKAVCQNINRYICRISQTLMKCSDQ